LLALHGTLAGEAAVAPAPAVASIASSRLVGGRTIALGLALAAVAVLVVAVLPDGGPEPTRAVITAPQAGAHPAPAASAAVPGSDLVARAGRWLDADPLRTELSALRSDARRGVSCVLGLALGGLR
jgi:hypothetical protein